MVHDPDPLFNMHIGKDIQQGFKIQLKTDLPGQTDPLHRLQQIELADIMQQACQIGLICQPHGGRC
jgi:hypothetical protein